MIRNEWHFSIYNFKKGARFNPDFVLFMKSKKGKELTYQIFIGPKNLTLTKAEPWKKEFLLEIQERFASSGFSSGPIPAKCPIALNPIYTIPTFPAIPALS